MATAAVTYTFVDDSTAEASEVNTNFSDLVGFINTNAIQKDGSVAFTAVPSGPATDPTTDNQLARKAYVDGTPTYSAHGGNNYLYGTTGGCAYSGTVTSRYARQGDMVHWYVYAPWGTVTGAGGGYYEWELPVAATAAAAGIGALWIYDFGGTPRTGNAHVYSTTVARFWVDSAGDYVSAAALPIVTSGWWLFHLLYEAA